jgi:hypothetical protein
MNMEFDESAPSQETRFALINKKHPYWLDGMGGHELADAGFTRRPPRGSLRSNYDYYDGTPEGVAAVITFNARETKWLRVQEPGIPGDAGSAVTGYTVEVKLESEEEARRILEGAVGHLFTLVPHPGYGPRDSAS